MIKKLLFIGYEFHNKTRSVEFLLQLFGAEYDVVTCYVNLLEKTPWHILSDVNIRDVDVLVCLQVMPPHDELKKHFRFRHAVFFPMFDGCPSVKKIEKWYPYRNFQIISFSKTLAEQLSRVGLSAHAIQYFPPPKDVAEFGEIDSLFFWNRREKININTVSCLLRDSVVRNIHVHKVLDPGNRFIEPLEKEGFNYSFSSWYETRAEMQTDMESASFYMAPREKEGIGMSFLEAMAMGRCVIAPDHPTMNEYIVHGTTGYLYNLKNPERLLLGDVRTIQQNVIRYMKNGYETWSAERSNILEWSEAPLNVSKIRLMRAMCIRFFRNPYKLLRTLYKSRGSH